MLESSQSPLTKITLTQSSICSSVTIFLPSCLCLLLGVQACRFLRTSAASAPELSDLCQHNLTALGFCRDKM